MSRERKIVINEISEVQQELGSLRIEEKSIKEQENYVTSLPMVTGDDLYKSLQKILPANLLPKNIGSIEEITWPNWYELEFDFTNGADTDYIVNDRKSSYFQIGQEAGFLLTHIYRTYRDSGIAGQGAPLHFAIKNVQSTRQFNDSPIQLQHIGTRSKPYKLPVPILLQPNEKIEVEMESWFGSDINIPASNGKHSLTFMGRRVRMKDMLKMKADLIAAS
jgi:hypothetical protein